MRRFDYIVQAVARAGAGKVIFGCDGPWLHPGLEIHKIKLLRLPPEQEAMILGGTVLRLLRRLRRSAPAIERSATARPLAAPAANRAVDLGHHLPPPIEVEHEL